MLPERLNTSPSSPLNSIDPMMEMCVKDSVYSLLSLRTESVEGHKEYMNLKLSGSRSSNAILTMSKPWRAVNHAASLEVFKLGVRQKKRRGRKEKHDKVRVHDWIIQSIKGQCNSLTWEKKQFVPTTLWPWHFEWASPWKTLSDCFCGKLEILNQLQICK